MMEQVRGRRGVTVDRRPRSGLAVIVVAALLVVACGADEEPAPGTEAAVAEDGEEDATAEAEDADAAPEEPATDVLAGQQIDFVVPYSAGGGYDRYARLLEPYLEEVTGATIVVQNEEGAGGALATNRTGQEAGNNNRIQLVDIVGSVGAQIAASEGITYDLGDFTWLARLHAEPRVILVAPDSEFETFEDMMAGEPRFGLSGPGGHDFISLAVLEHVFDLEADWIPGYPGASEIIAALLSGDIDATILSVGPQMENILSGEVRAVAIIGAERQEALPDVPTVLESEPSDPDLLPVLEAQIAVFEASRSVAGPPGMDEEVAAALRAAFDQILSDPDFLEEAEAQGSPITALDGQGTGDLIRAMLTDSPQAYRDVVTEASQD